MKLEIFPILLFFAGTLLGSLFLFLFERFKFLKTKEKLQKEIELLKKQAEGILAQAKEEGEKIKNELARKERFLFKKEREILEKENFLREKEENLKTRILNLKKAEEEVENKRKELHEKLQKVISKSKEELEKELLEEAKKELQVEVAEKIKKLEEIEKEKIEKRAKEILITSIQRLALPLTQEITTTTIFLPDEDIKGKIIGKEGRNIRTLEKLTGVEIILDEQTPQVLTISAFDPIRRQVAKIAIEKLIQDGRIQPAKIEEKVKEAEEAIQKEIREAGEMVLQELGIFGIDPKLVQLLGRLKFRTSYGQNVLLHSLEVAYLAEAIANEIGLDSKVCKMAGIFHDIGKAVDHQVSGSHVQIGMRILEKFGIENRVILAMKSHHEEFPPEIPEAVIVQVADQISGARPGARKETVEQYIKKLEDLEKIALSFPGVEKAWALEGGREIRVFVKAEEIDDFGAKKLAKQIAKKIEEELKYPGVIKVAVIRELRVIEYAK